MLQQRRRQRRSIRTDNGDSFSSSCSQRDRERERERERERARARASERASEREKERDDDAEGSGAAETSAGSGRHGEAALIAPGLCTRRRQIRHSRPRHTACWSPMRPPNPRGPTCTDPAAAQTADQCGGHEGVSARDLTTLSAVAGRCAPRGEQTRVRGRNAGGTGTARKILTFSASPAAAAPLPLRHP